MTVRLARGTSVHELVLFLRTAAEEGTSRREVLAELTERFALSFDDARLVIDRVGGGVARATSRNPANEPDPVKDPVAWASYRFELGLPVAEGLVGPSPEERASAEALLEKARGGAPTTGTKDVAVALEVARLAVASREPDPTRFRLLLEAATSLSVAAEACIDRPGQRSCAPEGSQEWVDGIALATAARQVTAMFAAQPDPDLEERGLQLVGRIVTRLLGQCHAFVGGAMVDSAHCIMRNGDPERAASHVEAMLSDFGGLLDQFADHDPVDEQVIALEHFLTAVDLLIEVRGSSPDLNATRGRIRGLLHRTV